MVDKLTQEEQEKLEQEKLEQQKQFEFERQKFVEAVMTQLESFPNKPSAPEIEKWKTEKGSVFLVPLGEEEFYLFTSLTRRDYLEARKRVTEEEQRIQLAVEEKKEYVPNETVFEDYVLEKCILWQSIDDSLDRFAGSAEAMFEQIMSKSNFVNAAAVAQLVIKL